MKMDEKKALTPQAMQDTPTYAIGAASQLSGVGVDSIRVWERRYGAVAPQRNERNKRRYTRDDVMRLRLIKRLIENGNPVSTVAYFSDEELRARLQIYADAIGPIAKSPARPSALVYGGVLGQLLSEHWTRSDRVSFEAGYTDITEFELQALASSPEVLILDFPFLNQQWVDGVLTLRAGVGASRVIVVYGYANSVCLERLTSLGVVILRAPVTLDMLEQACLSPSTAASLPYDPAKSDAVGARSYDDRALAALTTVSTAIQCECPHHLADLLFRLTAFETYSADCESRSTQDAALHAVLYRHTAQARGLIEQALDHLIQMEGIELPDR